MDTTGTGVTVGPADRGRPGPQGVLEPDHRSRPTPGATYKILVNGRSGGFRHQSIVDVEAMFQKLGAENGFDVDIWDPNINQSPGRQAPAGVSLPTSPLLDLAALMQYKTIVFDSTVGLNAAGLTSMEFANLQSYVRAGGGCRGHPRWRPTRCRTCPGTWIWSAPASPTTAAMRAGS